MAKVVLEGTGKVAVFGQESSKTNLPHPNPKYSLHRLFISSPFLFRDDQIRRKQKFSLRFKFLDFVEWLCETRLARTGLCVCL